VRAGAAKGILSAVDGAHVTGMMKVNVHHLAAICTHPATQVAASAEGQRLLYVRDEVMDRIWCTIATEGWTTRSCARNDFSGLAAQTFRHSQGCAPQSSSRINWHGPHRKTPPRDGRLHFERDAQTRRTILDISDPALRCGIATITVAPVKMPDLEKLCGKKRRFAYAERRRTKSACLRRIICFEETWTTSSQPSTSTGKHERAGFGTLCPPNLLFERRSNFCLNKPPGANVKIYNVTGYLIIFAYMLACMYSAQLIWTLAWDACSGIYFIFCWFLADCIWPTFFIGNRTPFARL